MFPEAARNIHLQENTRSQRQHVTSTQDSRITGHLLGFMAPQPPGEYQGATLGHPV